MTREAQAPTESTPQDRACLVARMARRAFGDDDLAAHWLALPNDALGGCEPLFVARESASGCARVCQVLDSFLAG